MRMFSLVLSLVVLSNVEAGKRRRFQPVAVRTTQTTVSTPTSISQVTTTEVSWSKGSDDALNEVNARRAARGLRPYLHDPLLTKGALACAIVRAKGLIRDHLPNDFAYLPAGAAATASGCAGLEESWGFQACCVYDNYTYCGAAWVRGADGKRGEARR